MVRWLDVFICAVKPKQRVVGRRPTHDGKGSKVTKASADAKDRIAHVCPFVRDSIDQDLFWIEESTLTDAAAIEAQLLSQIPVFQTAAPAFVPSSVTKPPTVAAPPEMLKTFLLFFPYFPRSDGGTKPCSAIDDLHRRVKPEFMKHGLMIGQFYHGCAQQSVYADPGDTFGVLFAPHVAFAIRYMARHDPLFIDPKNTAQMTLFERFFPPAGSQP